MLLGGILVVSNSSQSEDAKSRSEKLVEALPLQRVIIESVLRPKIFYRLNPQVTVKTLIKYDYKQLVHDAVNGALEKCEIIPEGFDNKPIIAEVGFDPEENRPVTVVYFSK